jgi:N-acetylglucosaminyldiphosphoundecaprenol N-acetyl-beta-D-mannosaminyltransferase
MTHPAWRTHWRELTAHITLIQSEDQLVQALDALAHVQKAHVLAFVNAHAMNCAAEDKTFFEALRAADTLYRDGIGMDIMYRMQGTPAGLNLNGTDLIPQLLVRFNGQSIALYGTQEPYLGQAAKSIAAGIAPNSLIQCADGFQPVSTYIELAKAQRPQLIVLGMGMPKQEQVAAQLRGQLSHACLIVCGGAIIDFMGGKVSRAPAWMRRLNVEWVYRLAMEPTRLFKRYVMGNPKFLYRALQRSKHEN